MKIVVFFLNFAQNIDQVRTDAVLSSTYNLSFRAKQNKTILHSPINPSFAIQKWNVSGLNYTGVLA